MLVLDKSENAFPVMCSALVRIQQRLHEIKVGTTPEALRTKINKLTQEEKAADASTDEEVDAYCTTQRKNSAKEGTRKQPKRAAHSYYTRSPPYCEPGNASQRWKKYESDSS